MTTDDLIDRLASDLRPVAPNALGRLLVLALPPALAVSAALIVFVHGLRPDLAQAILLPAFWVKSAYPLLLAIIGIGAMVIVARPGGVPRAAGASALLVYIGVLTLALWQLHLAPAADYRQLVFGVSAWFCPIAVLASGAPILAALTWFLRKAAPTRLRLAGFVAGITSGAAGAWVYSWGCIENGLTFVALWYTTGILLMGLIGMASGRRLLAW
ncbi:DUF1109 domain-containing protein [Rhizobium sp. 0TCS1.26]|uniref:NrsF family protein n=1 Tax=Rhizobium sp. 0TCS1.26 TaxID=3142623 RepID=UPI003D2CDE89